MEQWLADLRRHVRLIGESEMLVLLFPVSIAALLVGLFARGQPLTGRETSVLRIVLATVSSLFAIVGVGGFIDLVREPWHSLEDSPLAFAAFGALAVGGLSYTVGAALWRRGAGFALRLSGWVLMVLVLALPSQLVLGLPLACTLAVGLQHGDGRQTHGRAGDRGPVPHPGPDRLAQ
jgi:hypothetical protein